MEENVPTLDELRGNCPECGCCEWAANEIANLRKIVRDLYEPACAEMGPACEDIGSGCLDVLDRALRGVP